MGNGLREKINGQKYIYMYIYIYISIYLYTRASLETMIFKLAAKSNDKNTIKNKNNNNI